MLFLIFLRPLGRGDPQFVLPGGCLDTAIFSLHPQNVQSKLNRKLSVLITVIRTLPDTVAQRTVSTRHHIVLPPIVLPVRPLTADLKAQRVLGLGANEARTCRARVPTVRLLQLVRFFRHAISVAIHRDENGNLYVAFYEPQPNPSCLQPKILTPDEIQSCICALFC